MAAQSAASFDAYLDQSVTCLLQNKAAQLERQITVKPNFVLALGGWVIGLLPLLFCKSPAKSENAKALPPATLAILALTGGLDFFCTDQFQPSMPQMAEDFQIAQSSMSLAVQTHQVSCGLATLVFGPLSDHVGRQKVLLFLQLLLVISTCCCAMAPSYGWFLLGRMLQGTGSSSIAIVLAISRDCYEKEEERLRVGGLLFTCMLLGPLIAPPIGGFLATKFGWRSSFFMLTGVSSSVFLCSLLLVKETFPEPPKSSYLQAAWRTLANKKRFLLLILIALIKTTFSILDNSNAFTLETVFNLPVQDASYMVTCLALSGAMGVVVSSVLGQKPMEIMKSTMPLVLVAGFVDLMVGTWASSKVKFYVVCICFQHFVLMIQSIPMNVEFLQDLEDIAGMASCVQTAGAFSLASLLSLPALPLAKHHGAGGMLCALASVIFVSQLLLKLLLHHAAASAKDPREPSEVRQDS